MAIIVDQTFDSGIPSGFADQVSQGTLGVSYNAGAAAVDLVATTCQNYWRILAAGARQQFSIIADIEVIADSSNRRHLGFGVLPGANSAGYRIATLDNNNSYTSYWNASWGETSIGVSVRDFQPVIEVGGRYVMRLDVKRSVGNTVFIEWFINDARVYRKFVEPNYMYEQDFYPAIFCYGISLRIHSIQVASPSLSAVSDDDLDFRGKLAPIPLLVHAPTNPPPPLNFSNHLLVSEDDLVRHRWLFGGSGKVSGTIKRKGLHDDTPLARQVYLIDEATRMVVGAAWSSAETGYYEFLNVALEYENGPTPQGSPAGPLFWGNTARRTYTVLAKDYTQHFRAVIADNLTAEPM